nr:GAF domain-containing protein [uncultured Arsenicibacter sp.]
MKSAPLPANESDRLKALASYNVLDTLPEDVFDDVVRLASEICRTPISSIAFIDKDRQWFKAKKRLADTETPRDHSFCAHAIVEPDNLMIVPDARLDERFADNPLTTGMPYVIFYAGVPLVDEDGFALGTLCVIDNRPRTLTDNQLLSLKALAKLANTHLTLRRTRLELAEHQRQIETVKERKARFRTFIADTLEPNILSIQANTQRMVKLVTREDQLSPLNNIREACDQIKKGAGLLP